MSTYRYSINSEYGGSWGLFYYPITFLSIQAQPMKTWGLQWPPIAACAIVLRNGWGQQYYPMTYPILGPHNVQRHGARGVLLSLNHSLARNQEWLGYFIFSGRMLFQAMTRNPVSKTDFQWIDMVDGLSSMVNISLADLLPFKVFSFVK